MNNYNDNYNKHKPQPSKSEIKSLLQTIAGQSDKRVRDWKTRMATKERELEAIEKEDPRENNKWNPFLLLSHTRQQMEGNIVVVSVQVAGGFHPTTVAFYVLVETVAYDDDELVLTGKGVKQMEDRNSVAPGWGFSSFPLEVSVSLDRLHRLLEKGKPEKEILDVWGAKDPRFGSMKKLIEAGGSLGLHANEIIALKKEEKENGKNK